MSQIGRDPQQPGAQWAGWVKAAQRPEGTDKGLLGHIFCLIGVAQEQVGEAEGRLLVLAD
jgi:hypothetical protein